MASLTRRWVRAAQGKARIWDTRKTTPGLRALEKAAVRAGGGANHRGSLSDFVMVKDNHLAGLTIDQAVRRARLHWPGRTVEVECDTREQVEQAVEAGADLVLLDNMTPDEVAACVAIVDGRCLVEVSGGVTIETLARYIDLGVDLISTERDHQLRARARHRPRHRDRREASSRPMLLVIDVGNTQTVIGLYGDGDLLDHWRIATNAERTSDEHALLFAQFLEQHGFSFDDDITGIAVSSVVPRLTARAARDDRPLLPLRPGGDRAGHQERRADPLRQPAARSAPTASPTRSGALDLYGGPAVVVDFGTATTFDAISANGEYLGGAIVPGIEISMDALFARAAWLRRVELVEPRNVIGRSTVESIEAGVVYGTVALVDGMVRRFEDELGKSTVIATGGLGGLIAPLSDTIQHHEPWLTLHGLRLIHQKNTDGDVTRPVPLRARPHRRRRCTRVRRARDRGGDRGHRSRSPGASCCAATRASSPSSPCRTAPVASSCSARRRSRPGTTSSPRCRSATGSAPPARW